MWEQVVLAIILRVAIYYILAHAIMRINPLYREGYTDDCVGIIISRMVSADFYSQTVVFSDSGILSKKMVSYIPKSLSWLSSLEAFVIPTYTVYQLGYISPITL